ncbi:tetratricopeptide repeat protein [Butyrivibrio sp. XB500-5]|uniref:tetratricopeptide repeat protein n=1 Tax=Butyrivibrio sp. XB500-5 TaxID=2364880 RepID=UPI0013147D71|nr:tetratricopeptide repeat protein [Butyrivibrio sp. XB500-5]
MKKTPLKYILMIVFSVPILLLAISVIGRVAINHSFVKAYDDSVYKTESESKLLYLNFPESFIPYYNLGNVSYERKEYQAAVGYYKKALTLYPDAKRECSIRINLALALCNTIDFYDLDTQEKIDTAIFILNMARDTLLENGWAVDEGDDYRDKDAQQLKEDIDKMIEKLKNPDQSSSSDEQNDKKDNQDDQDNGSSGGGGGSKENKQKEKLENNKKGAMEERRKEQKDYENNQKDKENDQNGGGQDQDGDDQNDQNNGDDQQNNGGSGDEDQNDQQNNGGSGDEDQNDQGGGNDDKQNGGGSGGNDQSLGGSGGSGGESEGDVYIKQW